VTLVDPSPTLLLWSIDVVPPDMSPGEGRRMNSRRCYWPGVQAATKREVEVARAAKEVRVRRKQEERRAREEAKEVETAAILIMR
jgi:hypothetical protein